MAILSYPSLGVVIAITAFLSVGYILVGVMETETLLSRLTARRPCSSSVSILGSIPAGSVPTTSAAKRLLLEDAEDNRAMCPAVRTVTASLYPR